MTHVTNDILDRLTQTIKDRRLKKADESYVASILEKGTLKAAKKLGEEATETVIAALSEDDTALAGEAADLLFHLMILLESRNMKLDDVLTVLAEREGLSGHIEKAGRP